MSNTLAMAEVKAFQNSLVDGNNPSTVGAAPPANPAALAALGGTFNISGHTEWVEGETHETGFTTTFNPNTRIPYSGPSGTVDIDLTTMREGEGASSTAIIYAAITARSYHTGIVHVSLMDGSVRAISDNISTLIWRGLGTRAGGEVPGEY
jgi:hypothetical protein